MEFETDKGERDAFIVWLKFWVVYSVFLMMVAFLGHLWRESRTKTAELATCQEMLPNLTIDCPLAAQVAECDAKYPWATCETTR